MFHGSTGQGFAFKRREKIKHEYNKLLRKERWKTQQSKVQLQEEYPEHLKHLYLAEKERLDEEQSKKKQRLKGRAADSDAEEEQIIMGSTSGKMHSNTTPDIPADQTHSSEAENTKQSERCGNVDYLL